MKHQHRAGEVGEPQHQQDSGRDQPAEEYAGAELAQLRQADIAPDMPVHPGEQQTSAKQGKTHPVCLHRQRVELRRECQG
jgi:hypothetical protein